MEHWREHITVYPAICHGKACIRSTRIFVSIILDNLAAGVREDELLHQYPALTQEDIHAALSYARFLACELTNF